MRNKQLLILQLQERDCIARKLMKCRKPANNVVIIYRMTPRINC